MRALLACLLVTTACGGGGAAPDDHLPYQKLSTYALFTGTGATQEPAAGVIPYEVNSPLFADFAGKHRFIYLPPGAKIGYQADAPWSFPTGSILIKTFAFPRDLRSADAGERLIETRLIIKDATGWTGHTYLWNDAQTEATLTPAGTRVMVSWLDPLGATQTDNYRVPDENQCRTCHGGFGDMNLLGVRTRQLNRDHDYGQGAVNQIDHLAAAGLFDTAPPDAAQRSHLAPPYGQEPLEDRARGYLDANCSHCHNDKGAARTTNLYLIRATAQGPDVGVCRTPSAAGRGSGGFKYDVAPGDPDHSIMVFRMRSAEADIKMPQITTSIPDLDGAALIAQWIQAMTDPACP